jgi:prepilin-type N-terminal cleavage/methylation domain-containing protein
MSLRRRGFTLIELLVVIAIIAILVAMLLPAVQQVREAARKSQCQDHLHNLGIAMHSYEGNFKMLPPGMIPEHSWTTGMAPPYAADQNMANWTWGAMILPFVEQKPAYDRLGVSTRRASVAVDDWNNTRAVFETPVDLFRCPSDAAPDLNTNGRRVRGETDGTLRGTALANYVGVNRGHRPATNPGDQGYEIVHSRDVIDPRTGSFLLGSGVRFQMISDGTSNTLWIGERIYRIGDRVGTWDPRAGNVFVSTGRGSDIFDCAGDGDCATDALGALGFHGPNQSLLNADGSKNDGRGQCGFSSLHPGGAQFVLGDGKVTFLSENIDLFVASYLALKADGQPVRVP